MTTLTKILIGGLVVLVFLLILFFSFISNRGQNTNQPGVVVQNTQPGFLGYIQNRLPGRTAVSTIAPSPKQMLADEQKKIISAKNTSDILPLLNQIQQNFIADLKNNPIQTEGYSLNYNSTSDIFNVTSRSASDAAALRDIFRQAGLENVLTGTAAFNLDETTAVAYGNTPDSYVNPQNRDARIKDILRENLPYRGRTFTATYNETKDVVEVKKTGPDENASDKEIAEWAAGQGREDDVNNPEIFEITNASDTPSSVPQSVVNEAVQDVVDEQNDLPNSSESINDSSKSEETIAELQETFTKIFEGIKFPTTAPPTSAPSQPGQTANQPGGGRTPTQSGALVTEKVEQLVADIQANCFSSGLANPDGNPIGAGEPGNLDSGNISCLDKLTWLDSLTREVITTQTTQQRFFQCVGFAYAATALTTGQTFRCGGNAKDMVTSCAAHGYEWIPKESGKKVMPGDLPVWTGGAYGHVAFVVKVIDDNSFVIAEANYNLNGGVRLRTLTYGDSFAGWLTNPANHAIFSPAQPIAGNYKRFLQCEPSVAGIPLPGGCTNCNAGCSANAVAMVVAAYSQSNVSIQEVINKFGPGELNCEGLTTIDAAARVLREYNVEVGQFKYLGSATTAEAAEVMKNYLDNGWTLLTGTDYARPTGGVIGHVIWVVGTNETGIVTYDSFFGSDQEPPTIATANTRYKYFVPVKPK